MNVNGKNPAGLAAPDVLPSAPVGQVVQLSAADAAIQDVQKKMTELRLEEEKALKGHANLVGVIGRYMGKAKYVAAHERLLEVLVQDPVTSEIRLAAAKARNTDNKVVYDAARAICNDQPVKVTKETREILAEVHSIEDLGVVLRTALAPLVRALQDNSEERAQAVEYAQARVTAVIAFLTDYCPNLRRLDVSGMRFEVPNHLLDPRAGPQEVAFIPLLTPAHILLLAGFPRLHTLVVGSSPIDEATARELQHLTRLERLGIKDSPTVAMAVKYLPPRLKELFGIHYEAPLRIDFRALPPLKFLEINLPVPPAAE